jgi:RHS repeat-associated protein
MMRGSRGKRFSKGAAVSEFLVAVPAMLALGLGVVQSLHFYQAKTVLNYATFEAARKGATTHAQLKPMLDELGMRMAPVFGGDGSPEKLQQAIQQGRQETADKTITRLAVLSPSAAAFNDFARHNPETGKLEIPNHHLRYREHKKLGAESGVNIQDANLLTIEATYGYKLAVPFIGPLLSTALSRLDPGNRSFYAQGRIPMRASATVRMQSAAWQSAATEAVPPPPIEGSGSGDIFGQGNSFAKGDIFGNNKDCDPSRQSCTSNGLNQGNPDVCKAPAVKAGQGQTGGAANLPALSVGNPIHIGSGNKYQLESDLNLGVENGINLQWQRHYNSRRQHEATLGMGWSHSFDVYAMRSENGIVIRQADGREIYFEQLRGDRYFSWFNTDGWVEVAEGDNRPFRWHRLGGEVLAFSSAGRLVELDLLAGRNIRLQYDGEKRLHIIRDSNAREMVLSYYPNGRLRTVKAGNGHRVDYAYDDRSNLTLAVRDADLERHYHYEDEHDPNNLTGITNAEGIRYASWVYDESDRAIGSEHAGGVNRVSIEYAGDNKRYVTNSEGQRSTYTINSAHGIFFVESIEGPGCGTCSVGDTRYRYDENLALIESTNPDGSAERREYDGFGRLQAVYATNSSGQERLLTRYGFKGEERLPSVFARPSINPDGEHRIELTRGDQGQITTIMEHGWSPDFNGGYLPLQRNSRYEYRDGQLFASDGPVPGIADRIEYPLYKQKRRHPAQRQQNGNPKHIPGSDLNVRYSREDRAAIIEHEDGREYARLLYDKLGRPVSFIHEDKTSRVEYDAAGRLSRIRASDGGSIEWQWSAENQLLSRKHMDAAGNVIDASKLEYGKDNKLNAIDDLFRGKSNYQYDEQGRVIAHTMGSGIETTYAYNAMGLLDTITRLSGTDQAAKSQLHYDIHGNIVSVSDPRGNRSYSAYDDFGHKLYSSNPDRGVTMYRYDAAGNVNARVDESGVINTYHYDRVNRLTGVGLPGLSPTNRFEHDAHGHPMKREGLNEAVSYNYGARNRIDKRTTLKTLRRHYDSTLQIEASGIRQRTPGGAQIDIDISDNGDHYTFRLNGVEKAQIETNGDGRLGNLLFSNGISRQYRYKSGRLLSVETHKGDTKIGSSDYQYNERAHVTGIDERRINHSFAATFDYDIAGRLSTADINGERYNWHYDLNGNRIATAVGVSVRNYEVEDNNNRYKRIADSTIGYANTGEIVNDGELRYRYTVGHRLAAVYRDRTLLAKYLYNSEGERIRKTVFTSEKPAITYYLYDNQKLQAELDENGDIQREYIYLGNALLGFIENTQFYAIELNHLGAPTGVYDESGKLVWKAHYLPFGEAQVQLATIELNIRLPGQYFDKESGKHYNYLRTYDPNNGRYLSSDPLGIQPGFNTYAYVKNDPLNRVDPLGLYGKAVHYYLTYFIAVTAGLSKEKAQIMALATQYIDDNYRTAPLPSWENVTRLFVGDWEGSILGKKKALDSYHFVLDYERGDKGDFVTRRPGESDTEFALRRIRNPQSKQLERLRNASLAYDYYCRADGRASSLDTKLQLYGEYLHAFQDTFAHRDRNNRPYDLFGNSENDPDTDVGHISIIDILKSHQPDKTYNQIDFEDAKLNGEYGYLPSYSNQWIYNEARTLQMSKEVFEKIRRDFKVSSHLAWSDLAGDGGSRIGVNMGVCDSCWKKGVAPTFLSADGIEGVLQRFNAYNEDNHRLGKDEGLKEKIDILNNFLKIEGLGEIPSYDEAKADSNRRNVLLSVETPDGVIGEAE